MLACSKRACRGASQRLLSRAAVVSRTGGVPGGTRVLSWRTAVPQLGQSRGEGWKWHKAREGEGWKSHARAGTVAAIAAVLLSEEPRTVLAEGAELQGKTDQFGGVLIDHKTLPSSAQAFDEQLTLALAQWRAAGKKGIWLKLKPAHATLLATAYR
jgi:hypothetical protein